MSVSEQDIETLEMWLDSELSDEHTEALRQRLSAEPQLAEAAARLRGDRELRSRLWQALEPGEAEIESLVNQVRRGVRKEELITSRLRTFSRITAVAASIAVFFMAGWISRSRLRVGGNTTALTPIVMNQPGPANSTNVVQVQPTGPGIARLVLIPRISNFNNPMATVPVAQRIDMNGISKLAPNYQVQVIDPITHEVKFAQDIERLDDAMQFANYVARFRSGSDSLRQPESGQPMDIQPVNQLQPAQP